MEIIQRSNKRWTLADVYVNAGGLDYVHKKANSAAAIFRPHGGNPGKDRDPNTVAKVTAFTATGNYCLAYNHKNPHNRSSLLPDGKTCRFNHACDQFVKDKGPDGKCGGNHPPPSRPSY